ncbi:MAG: homeobox domain-containing protein, partial [Piptocephalis tieghemiana]
MTKPRRKTSMSQFRRLEETFHQCPKPDGTTRRDLAIELGMPVRAVQVWFQNRRAKAK